MSLHTYIVEDEAVGGKLKDKPSVPQSSERGLYKRKEKRSQNDNKNDEDS